MLTRILTAFCLAAAVAAAAEPRVTGPHQVAPGTLVVLTAEVTANTAVCWEAVQPLELECRDYNDGAELVFAAPCQPQRIVVTCLTIAVTNGKPKITKLRHVVDVGTPEPPPLPIPTPPAPAPNPTPQPQRITAAVIEESAERTPDQAAIVLDPRIAEYCKAGGHVWYVWDKDSEAQQRVQVCGPNGCRIELRGGVDPSWLPFFAAAKGKTLPRLVIGAGGKILSEGPLPDSVDKTLEILRKFGG
jgi:hypothetical protein